MVVKILRVCAAWICQTIRSQFLRIFKNCGMECRSWKRVIVGLIHCVETGISQNGWRICWKCEVQPCLLYSFVAGVVFIGFSAKAPAEVNKCLLNSKTKRRTCGNCWAWQLVWRPQCHRNWLKSSQNLPMRNCSHSESLSESQKDHQQKKMFWTQGDVLVLGYQDCNGMNFHIICS